MAFTQNQAQRGIYLEIFQNFNITSPSFGIAELANRKILEELQLKKQFLLKHGAGSNLNSPSSILPLVSTPTNTIPFNTAPAASLVPDSHSSSAARAALHSAHSQSFAYFVSQDSSFGNLILPVLPRFENK